MHTYGSEKTDEMSNLVKGSDLMKVINILRNNTGHEVLFLHFCKGDVCWIWVRLSYSRLHLP
jgi:hypothetical protein